MNRFDADTKATFFDLYTKIDAGIDPTEKVEEPSVEPVNPEEIPF